MKKKLTEKMSVRARHERNIETKSRDIPLTAASLFGNEGIPKAALFLLSTRHNSRDILIVNSILSGKVNGTTAN